MTEPLKKRHPNIDTKCLDELSTRIQKDERTNKMCQTNQDEDADEDKEFWIPIATVCKDELAKLSQEIVENHLNKNVDWRKIANLSPEDHDAVMWIAKFELVDLVGKHSDMAHSFNISTSKSRRTKAIVAAPADGERAFAGAGFGHRRKVLHIEAANKIADEIKAIEDDTSLDGTKKEQALRKKREEGIKNIDDSGVLSESEKERVKNIFSEDLVERRAQKSD